MALVSRQGCDTFVTYTEPNGSQSGALRLVADQTRQFELVEPTKSSKPGPAVTTRPPLPETTWAPAPRYVTNTALPIFVTTKPLGTCAALKEPLRDAPL